MLSKNPIGNHGKNHHRCRRASSSIISLLLVLAKNSVFCWTTSFTHSISYCFFVGNHHRRGPKKSSSSSFLLDHTNASVAAPPYSTVVLGCSGIKNLLDTHTIDNGTSLHSCTSRSMLTIKRTPNPSVLKEAVPAASPFFSIDFSAEGQKVTADNDRCRWTKPAKNKRDTTTTKYEVCKTLSSTDSTFRDLGWLLPAHNFLQHPKT